MTSAPLKIDGAVRAVMHLLYARFFTKVLFDEGLVSFSEPVTRLRNQGSMLSPLDGARMSKSRGNVVTPDKVIEQYGADALRVALLFIGPFDQDVTWNPTVATGAARFVRRLFGLFVRAAAPLTQPDIAEVSARDASPAEADEMRSWLHRLIKTSGDSIERFRFNALIAELMAFVNEAEAWETVWQGTARWRELIETLVRLCAPITPFVAEEAWSRLGQGGSVHQAAWPTSDPALTAAREYTVVIQVDGRVRDRITVAADVDQDTLVRLAAARLHVREAVKGRRIGNVVVVPGRIVNFVTR